MSVRHLLIGILLIAVPAVSQEVPLEKRAADYLVAHFQSPENYVISKFKTHDIVFLGESTHGVRQNELFLQKLIPLLYKAGVRKLGYEMALSDDQPEIDRILAADRYDNEAVLTLLFHWDAQIGWAFQEYADVLRAAWTLNRGLPKNAPKFRIVATDLRPDWSLVKPGDKIVSRPIRWRAWWGSNHVARNVWIAGVVQREFIDKELRALVFNSAGHVGLVVTRDVREEVGVRLSAAYQIRRRIGNRVTSIQMDRSITQNPATSGIIALLPPKYQLIGFDLKGTPIGDVPLPEKIAASIYTDKTPADHTVEGIVQVSLTTSPVTPEPGFITAARVQEAKRGAWLPNVPEITVDWILQHQRQILSR